MFLNQEQLEEYRIDPPGMFYEYLTQACERGINGYPTFMSVQIINKEDFAKFREIAKALREAKDKVLASYAKPGDPTAP